MNIYFIFLSLLISQFILLPSKLLFPLLLALLPKEINSAMPMVLHV